MFGERGSTREENVTLAFTRCGLSYDFGEGYQKSANFVQTLIVKSYSQG